MRTDFTTAFNGNLELFAAYAETTIEAHKSEISKLESFVKVCRALSADKPGENDPKVAPPALKAPGALLTALAGGSLQPAPHRTTRPSVADIATAGLSATLGVQSEAT